MTLTSIEIAGNDLEVLDLAGTQAHHPPIVLLHEGLGCVAMWRDFPHLLATATGARVIAYSRYGYGGSTALPAGVRGVRTPRFMHDEATDALPQILQSLNIQRPILIGHSDGGSIALLYASAYPNALHSAVVMAPHCFVEDSSIESIQSAKETFESGDLARRLAKYHRDVTATFYGWNDVWLSAAFRSWNIEAELAAIRCPVLAIQGDDDPYGTMAQIDAIARKVGSAQLLQLRHCGHAVWRDRTDAVIAAITAFTRHG
jgi:pimeloyl-ACP methyl ester carboxylesterase